MSNPTSNYSFQMPTSTDLVTDLPADFEVFGQAVDTQLKALNPSTTLGDIEYRSSTANTNTRLGIGTSGQVLAVSGGVPAWTTVSSGGMTLLASGSINATDFTLSSISGSYIDLLLVLENITTVSSDLDLRINGETGSRYFAAALAGATNSSLQTAWNGPLNWTTTARGGSLFAEFRQYKNTSINKVGLRYDYNINDSLNSDYQGRSLNSDITAAITSITIISNSGFTANYKLYGVS